MNRLIRPIYKTTNFLYANNGILTNNMEVVVKRNMGFVTQQPKILQRNRVSSHGSTFTKRYNSTEAAVATVDPGFFASFYQSLSNCAPVSYVQQGLIEIHDFTGLPWWASIVVTTFLFRSLVTLPLTIYQHKITARIEKISLEMPAIVEELKKEAAMAMRKFKWTEKQTKLVYQRSVSI